MSHVSSSELFQWLNDTFHGAPRGIIFDCDGVIIDSRQANISYYNALRAYFGLPPISHEQENFAQMATVHQSLNALFPKALQPLLREAAQHVVYERDIMPKITYYPGLHALLDLCKEHNIRLGMDTNREDCMDMLLDNCHLHGYFDPIVLACHVRSPKPAPDGALMISHQWGIPPERLLFLGDSATDRDAARDAGIPFLTFQTQNLSTPSVSGFDTIQEALGHFWK